MTTKPEDIVEIEIIPGDQQKSQFNFNQQQKTIAALGYVFFLLPIIVDFNNKFYRFHANQSLCLLIYLAIITALSIIPGVGWLMTALGWILGVLFFLFGIVSAYTGNQWRIPIIGIYDLIDFNSDTNR
jgi:Predicted membrane protein